MGEGYWPDEEPDPTPNDLEVLAWSARWPGQTGPDGYSVGIWSDNWCEYASGPGWGQACACRQGTQAPPF